MNHSPQVHDIVDLLRLSTAADLSDLEEILLARADFHDDDGEAEVETTDTGISVMLGGAGINAQGFDLSYPFSMEAFWYEVDEVDRLNLRRVRRRLLPETWFEDDGSVDNEELLDAMTDYFGWHRYEFDDIVGGGWMTLDAPVRTDGNLDPFNTATPDAFWVVAGDPLMVALGLGDDTVEVGSPTYHFPGLAGPALIEVEVMETIDLDDDSAATKITAALSKATAKTRRRCGICSGCRTLQLRFDSRPGFGFWCRSCMQRSGLVVC